MMKRATVALVGFDSNFAKDLIAVQGCLFPGVHLHIASPRSSKADITVVKFNSQDEIPGLISHFPPSPGHLILVGCDQNLNNLSQLQLLKARHLIGGNGQSVAHEVAATINKLATGNIWGFEPYFYGFQYYEIKYVRSASDIPNLFTSFSLNANFESLFEMATDYTRVIINELVSNAVYNAPVDDQGKGKYESTDRKIKVELKESEKVSVSLCSNDELFGISVQDNFGRLAIDRLIYHIAKSQDSREIVEHRAGGAGAGLFMIFHSANALIVNSQPGKRTEVICLIEKTKRYRLFRARVTSLHFFEVGG